MKDFMNYWPFLAVIEWQSFFFVWLYCEKFSMSFELKWNKYGNENEKIRWYQKVYYFLVDVGCVDECKSKW